MAKHNWFFIGVLTFGALLGGYIGADRAAPAWALTPSPMQFAMTTLVLAVSAGFLLLAVVGPVWMMYSFFTAMRREASMLEYAKRHPDEIQSIGLQTSDEQCVVTMRNKPGQIVVATGNQAIEAAALLQDLAHAGDMPAMAVSTSARTVFITSTSSRGDAR